MTKSRPVLIMFSVLAALDFIAAYAGLSDHIGTEVAFFFIMGTKAVQVGCAFYSQGITVPLGDVSAYVNKNGSTIAGPASDAHNGAPVVVRAHQGGDDLQPVKNGNMG